LIVVGEVKQDYDYDPKFEKRDIDELEMIGEGYTIHDTAKLSLFLDSKDLIGKPHAAEWLNKCNTSPLKKLGYEIREIKTTIDDTIKTILSYAKIKTRAMEKKIQFLLGKDYKRVFSKEFSSASLSKAEIGASRMMELLSRSEKFTITKDHDSYKTCFCYDCCNDRLVRVLEK
jgi:hypothetical protein